MKLFIGIDPGVKGGIVALDEEGRVEGIVKMPSTERGIIAELGLYRVGLYRMDIVNGYTSHVMLERVIPFSAPGRTIGVTSAFTSGKGYGTLLTALTALRLPFDIVMPATWQRAMGCLTKGDKAVSKRRAVQLFPDVKITNYTADALVIAEYCRRFHLGMFGQPSTPAAIPDDEVPY